MPSRHSINCFSLPQALWKKKLARTLMKVNIVSDKFTGKAILYFQNGMLACIEKTEPLK